MTVVRHTLEYWSNPEVDLNQERILDFEEFLAVQMVHREGMIDDFHRERLHTLLVRPTGQRNRQ